MGTSTTYLRPPTPPRAKKAKPKTPWQQFTGFMFKYRFQMMPFLASFWIWLLAVLFGPEWWGGPMLAGLSIGLAAALYQDRYTIREGIPWPRLDRPVERWYASACAAVVALWTLCATLGPSKPGLRATAALVLLTCVCSGPWWHHRRIRGSIPVRFDGLGFDDRKSHLEQARKLVQEWTAFTSAGHIQGAKLRGVTYNPWSVALAVQLRRGATVGEFTPHRLDKLESAFGEVRTGAARVERIQRHARLAVIRFMINDPHAEPIKPPETGQCDAERIVLGLFETGEEILFRLVNTLIAGATGAGKSGVINVLIRALARIPTVAIVGIDMKPGAPELGKWRKVMHALATDATEAADVLDRLKAGLTYRGQIMSANGWRKWKPTRYQPFIVLIVDEIQELKRARLQGKVDEIAAMIRAYGGCVVLATQYPSKNSLSPTIKSNCLQRIGLRMEEAVGDRVIFGEGASRSGWRPSQIGTDREGSLLIRNPVHKRPLLGRGFWMDDDDVDREADMWAPERTAIDDATWNPVTSGGTVTTAAVGSGETAELSTGDEIVDAVIVDDDPAERVLDALRRHSKVAALADATGLSRASLYRHLKTLADQGLVFSPKRGEWVREDSDETDSRSSH